MTADAIVALMLTLMPSAPRTRIAPIAEAIAAATTDREESALLAVITYSEDGLGRAGVPFGACSMLCAHRCHDCRRDVALADVARWSLGLLHRARRLCGVDIDVQLGWYHTGHCRSDPFSRHEAAMVEALRTRAPERGASAHVR